jgi:hypothetical protein
MRLEPARAKGIGSDGGAARDEIPRLWLPKNMAAARPLAENSGDKYPPALQSVNPVVGCAIRRSV